MNIKKLLPLIVVPVFCTTFPALLPQLFPQFYSSLLAQTVEEKKLEADRLLDAGNVLFNEQGDYEGARAIWQQSLEISRSINYRKGEMYALGNIGVYYRATGQYTKAIETLESVLQFTVNEGNKKGQFYALGQLGFLYRALGNFRQAREYFQKQLDIAKDLGEKEALHPKNSLGLIALDLDEVELAKSYFESALESARKLKVEDVERATLHNLALIYTQIGDPEKALAYYENLLNEPNSRKKDVSLGDVCLLYLVKEEMNQALEYCNRYVEAARGINDARYLSSSLNNLGLVYDNLKRYPEAEKYFLEAINLSEDIRKPLTDRNKIDLLDNHRSPYSNLQQNYINQNKIAQSLEISERARARAFVELLQGRLNNNQPVPIVSPNVEQIKQIAKQQNATIVQYSLIVRSFPKTHPFKIYMWVIKPSGEIHFRQVDIPLDKPLIPIIDDSLGAIAVRSGENQQPNQPKTQQFLGLSELHELLITPIADLLPANPQEKVVFVPERELLLIPFAALQDREGKYLIEKHTILISPSIQLLELTQKQRTKIEAAGLKEALVVGNPNFANSTPKLSQLPNAEKEAIAIANLLKTQPLIGNKATKNTILEKISQARWIHLATHGKLDDISGLNSFLAFTPTGNDNGLITAAEIFNLQLNAELVVLSACNTGSGRITGDGVIGLSRSIISAGAPSVIVSLWQVPDAPTAELMTAFYQNLQQNPDKAQALRQAMLTTMKLHPQPKNWAAFMLIGEAR